MKISKSNQLNSLMAYTFSHFCVDFTCFFVLFYGFKNNIGNMETIVIGFLIYNVIAFGIQPIIGYFCDERPQIRISIIGCSLVILGLITIYLPWFSILMCAFGNAYFHVGGGSDSLKYADGKMYRSGVFVSSGAVGVALGTFIGQSEKATIYLPLVFMIASIILLFKFTKKETYVVSYEFKVASDFPFAVILILAFVSIMIRSYVGGIIPINWKTTSYLCLIPGISSCVGKVLGGFLGDKFGARRVGVTSLIASIPFLLLGQNIIILSVIGIILFNITMPITLCALASKFPYNPGFAFGLTTLALLCGTLVTYFYHITQSTIFVLMVAFIIISAICTLLSTQNKKGDLFYD